MPHMKEILYKVRNSDTPLKETVPGFFIIYFLYSHAIQRSFLKVFVANRLVNNLYTLFMKTKLSKLYIKPFVKKYNINMAESEEQIHHFPTFNHFFVRKLKPTARPIHSETNTLLSPTDGKILTFPCITQMDSFHIKGVRFNLDNLLQDSQLSAKYNNASVAIIRLAPTDYHRFHFPTGGFAHSTQYIKGLYYSVSPIALSAMLNIFTLNKRTITQIDSPLFGTYLYIEVGATMVGSIVQTYTANTDVRAGDEKGYFQFGGSTVILLFEHGKVTFDKELIENTENNYETYIKMGERIGKIGQFPSH